MATRQVFLAQNDYSKVTFSRALLTIPTSRLVLTSQLQQYSQSVMSQNVNRFESLLVMKFVRIHNDNSHPSAGVVMRLFVKF